MRIKMEHEKYLELRKMNQEMGNPKSEMHLRRAAEAHALECCRLAVRQHNEIVSQ